ncbi:MAG TPA: hypothetical protein VHB99_16170 [Pirellulales bacterium]|nr:hypothetical protein [Pirellulales bacterium]
MSAFLKSAQKRDTIIVTIRKTAPRGSSQSKNVAGELWGDFLAAAAFVVLASSVLLQTLRVLLD